jgi:hypothetical protein
MADVNLKNSVELPGLSAMRMIMPLSLTPTPLPEGEGLFSLLLPG